MTTTLIMSYLTDALILLTASFFGVFVVEKNKIWNNSNRSARKSKHNKKLIVRILLKKSFWTLKFQKSFWKPIFKKNFHINVFSVFVCLLIFITIFKYYRYL